MSNYSGGEFDVWDDAARTLTDFSAEELFDLPDIDSIYPTIQITSSASANTFGSWVELSADVGTGKRLLFIVLLNSATVDSVEVEIGEGANPSEARVVGRVIPGNTDIVVMPAWLSLTNNARLSARVKDTPASAVNYRCTVWLA